jgi:hypothetical protein
MKTKKAETILQILFICLFIFICNDASAQTTQKLQSVYDWLKPVVNILLAILTLCAAAYAIYQTFFKHHQAPIAWGTFITGLVLWALWTVFAEEILSKMGGQHINF